MNGSIGGKSVEVSRPVGKGFVQQLTLPANGIHFASELVWLGDEIFA